MKLVLPVLVFTLALASTASAEDKTPDDEPLPKPASRVDDTGTLKKLPPFLGLFGPPEVIARHHFRSRIGNFIEYTSKGGAEGGQRVRIAEIGPAVPGARWISVTVAAHDANQGIKLLCRGEKEGNLEKLVLQIPGMPAMEMPLDMAAKAGGSALSGLSVSAVGSSESLGTETVKTPAGEVTAEHVRLTTTTPKERKVELWITDDPRVPFIGIVKMVAPESTVVATKIGMLSDEDAGK